MVEQRTIRKSKNDTIRYLFNDVEKLRRKVSRLKSFGSIPEEVADKVLRLITEIRKELENGR